jgi:lysophospholipase L1-like esterase
MTDRPQATAYLALGDSYTIGEGVDAAGRWPTQLAAALREQGIAISRPRVIAATGWTTDELDVAIDAAEPLGEYGFVSLQIGVNNQYRGRPVAEYREQFAALLKRAIGFARGRVDRVLALSIPDWGATRFGRDSGRDLHQIARELDAYNVAARDICVQHGAAFIDVTAFSRERGGEDGMLAADGLHPSAAMYTAWVRLALPAARKLLATP